MSKGFEDGKSGSDLKKILPGVEVVTSIGTVQLVPFRFRDLNKGLELLGRWFQLLINIDGSSPQVIIATLAMAVQKNIIPGDSEEGSESSQPEITGLDVHGDLMEMVNLSLPKKDPVKFEDGIDQDEWIEELSVAEVIQLAMEIFELNKGFFGGKLKKFGITAKAVDPTQKENQNPGQESLADSSEVGTDSQTS